METDNSRSEDSLPIPSGSQASRGAVQPWHSQPPEAVARSLGTNLSRGLSVLEAKRRLLHYGRNALRQAKTRSRLAIFLSQFTNLPMVLLLVAIAVAFGVGRHLEAIAIFAVVLMTAALGYVIEHKAERSVQALRRLSAPTARVIRGGRVRQIPADELVPGDLMAVEAGDRVPADARLIEANDLLVDEASLTGESFGVTKDDSARLDPDTPLAERPTMLYMGTIALEGNGQALVTATGMATEMGHISRLLEETDEQRTPLERRLAYVGRQLIWAVLAFCTVYVLVGFWRGEELGQMAVAGLVLAIAAVPEGLPAVAAITLALGMQRMARRAAIMRRLPAVETLGSVTVIATDKTGTLTKGEMAVRETWLARDKAARPAFEEYHQRSESGSVEDNDLRLLLTAAALCNDAVLQRLEQGEGWETFGDPTEAALLVAARKAGLDPNALAAEYRRVDEQPFDPTDKYMVTVHETPGGGRIAFVKGAPDAVLARCVSQQQHGAIEPLDDEGRRQVVAVNDAMAGRALRVLALAFRELTPAVPVGEGARDLVLLGLVGMMDPPRPEAREAIARCKTAGIRVVMITGDQRRTAEAIAAELSLTSGGGLTVEGRELQRMTGDQLAEAVQGAAVFARVSPEHKLMIVEGLQKQGHIVAMTGDGVNDAPALKKADIGIAMGRKGSDVAKESADMVLADDNFATIVAAVEEGRTIFANIRKFIHYLFSCNLSEVLTMFVAVLAGLPFPLLPLQLLWMNLTTDTFPALALAAEPAEPATMRRPPRDPKEGIMPRSLQLTIARQAVVLAAVTLLAFLWALHTYGDQPQAETIAFATLSLAQIWHALNARSRRHSIFQVGLLTNRPMVGAIVLTVVLLGISIYFPPLAHVLELAPLGFRDWLVVVPLSVAPVIVVEIAKRVGARGPKPTTHTRLGPRLSPMKRGTQHNVPDPRSRG
ncbi:MAG: cation-translocating P-type ATPase [Anaerolineales bacterium]